MTIAEIILLILVIVMMIIHIKLYIKFKEQQEELKEAATMIHDLLIGKARIGKILTEEEFKSLINGGKEEDGTNNFKDN